MLDLIIIGAGPAGLTASIYASRYKLNHLVVGNIFDGAITKAHLVENWPGEKSIKGYDLIMKFYEHAKSMGAEVIQENIVEVKTGNGCSSSLRGHFIIKTENNSNYKSKSLLVALGAKSKKLNIPGEDKFLGSGVSYCAVCDGTFFKNKIVGVVGGSNSAAMAAIMLSEHANKVFLIYRGQFLRCEPVVAEKLEKNCKVKIIYNTNVITIGGEKKVEFIELDNEYEGKRTLRLDGLFIEAGSVPFVSLIKKLGVKTDQDEFIIINQSGATNIDGVYAAGDITNGSNGLRQIITAASEGAIAAASIYKYLRK